MSGSASAAPRPVHRVYSSRGPALLRARFFSTGIVIWQRTVVATRGHGCTDAIESKGKSRMDFAPVVTSFCGYLPIGFFFLPGTYFVLLLLAMILSTAL